MTENLFEPGTFSTILFERMQAINPGLQDLELYEFCYGLNNLVPSGGWDSISLEQTAEIDKKVNDRLFYDSIQIKPKVGDRIVLDERALALTRMLLVGLVTGDYSIDWVRQNFYFDIRGFYFPPSDRIFHRQCPGAFWR